MIQPPTFRPATLADVDAVARLTDAAYAPYVALLGRKPRPMTTDYLHFVSEHRMWLLEAGEELVGLLALQHEPDALLHRAGLVNLRRVLVMVDAHPPACP